MKKQKVDTKLGVAIIIIFAITVGALMWIYGNVKSEPMQQNQITNNVQQKNQFNQNILEGEEFPSIPVEQGLNLEDIIKQALYKKVPDWKNRNYNITVTIEMNQENHAIGKFIYDGYNILKNGEKHHNTSEGIWFASELDNTWTLTGISYVGYWGNCQDFERFNFPKDMTPDCWDIEKNILINTLNPQRFYGKNFTIDDKDKLIQAFITYSNKTKASGNYVPESYFTKKLYLRINKQIGNYVRGTILVGGTQNISAPEFFAVKENNQWKVVHNGQDYPSCSIIKPYKFPRDIVAKCYNETTKRVEEAI